MAQRDGDFIKGPVGPVSFKKYNDKQLVVSKPGRGNVKQAIATIQSANTFGMASSLGKYVRQSLAHLIGEYHDGEMGNRITTQLNACLIASRDPHTRKYDFNNSFFSRMADLDYCIKSPLKKSLLVNPQVVVLNGSLQVSFSALSDSNMIKFPKGYINCIISVSVSFFRLMDNLWVRSAESQDLTIKKDTNSLSGKELLFEVPNGSLCVISIFLSYFKISSQFTTLLSSKTFSPSGILDAFITAGEYVEDGRHWEQFPDLSFE